MKRQGKGPSRRERKKAEQERPSPHSCPDTMKVRQACQLLGQLAGAGQQAVLIGRMLEILDPEHKVVPSQHPLADPVFGTMPVDAASYESPGGQEPESAGPP